MMLFTVQLVRVVLAFLPLQSMQGTNSSNFAIGINEMFNLFISTSFVLLITFTWQGHYTNNNIVAGLNEFVLR